MLDWLKKLFGGDKKEEQPVAGMEEAPTEQPAPEAPVEPVAPEEEVQN